MLALYDLNVGKMLVQKSLGTHESTALGEWNAMAKLHLELDLESPAPLCDFDSYTFNSKGPSYG